MSKSSDLASEIAAVLPAGIVIFDGTELMLVNPPGKRFLASLGQPESGKPTPATLDAAVTAARLSHNEEDPRLILATDGENYEVVHAETERGLHVFTARNVTEIQRERFAMNRDRAVIGAAEKLARFGYFVFDPTRMSTEFISEGIYKLARSMRRESGEQSIADLLERVHPDDRDAVTRIVLGAVNNGDHIEIEFRAVTADGEIEHLWLSDTTIINSQTGRVQRVGLIQDVTADRQQRAALAESMAMRGASLESALDCVITIEDTGKIIEFNPAAESVFGFSRDEVIGQVLSDTIVPPQMRKAHQDGLARYLRSGEHNVLGKRIEVQAIRRDGLEFPVELAITPVDVNGRKFFTAYLRDITDRVESEAALREAKDFAEHSNEAKSDFLAMMSHEIRTPLNGVLGTLELLQHTHLEPTQASYVKTAVKSGETLLSILNNILDLSKIEAGKLEPERRALDVRDIVEGIADIMRPEVKRKNLTMTTLVSPLVPRVINGDPGFLRQILLNLASNAVKFTETGGVTIDLDYDLGPLPQLTLEVSDTGVGFSEDQGARIFSRFEQIEIGRGRKSEGAGLGLSIVKELIELLEGTCSFESRPGSGTIFKVCLPFDRNDTQMTDEDQEVTIGNYHNVRVLLAEDSPTNATVAIGILRTFGIEPEVVEDGQSAVKAASVAPYDLIFMDISMPEIDGLEATIRIRKGGPNAGSPIVAMTAHTFDDDIEMARDAGMNDYLPKPINRKEMKSVLKRWIGRSQSDHDTYERSSSSPAIANLFLEERIAELGEPIVRAIINTFLTEGAERMGSIECAIAKQEWGLIVHHAHALKGGADNLGALKLSEVAEAWEINSAPGNVNNLNLDELKDVWLETCTELEHWREIQ